MDTDDPMAGVFAPPGAADYNAKTLPNLVAETTTYSIIDIAEGAVANPSKDILLPVSMREFGYVPDAKDPQVIAEAERNQSIVFGELTESIKKCLDEDTYTRLYDKVVNKSILDEESAIETGKQPKKIRKAPTKVRKGTLRDFFEPSTPVTQCNNTVGSQNQKSMCWICDTPIYGGEKYGFKYAPECEHVFPVMQALCFTGLYSAGIYEGLKDEADKTGRNRGELYKQELQREYRWAHEICNQVKSNTHFIVLGNDLKFGIEKRFIKQMLFSILETKNYGSPNTVAGGPKLWEWIQTHNKNTGKKDWVDTQTEKIFTICSEITNQANKLGYTPSQFLAISVMKIREYVAMDPDISKPNVRGIPRTAPSVGSNVSLYTIRSSDLIPVVELYARDIHRIMTGFISSTVSEAGAKGTGLRAFERAELSSQLARRDIENEFVRIMTTDPDVLYKYRELREALFVLSYNKNNHADQPIWSDIQTIWPIMIYVFILWRSFLSGTQTIPALMNIQADSPFVKILQSKAQAEVNKQMATVDSVLTAKFGAQYTIDNILKNIDEIMNSIPEGTSKRWFGEGRKTRKTHGKRNRKTYRRQK
jgi:hypothetical protein